MKLLSLIITGFGKYHDRVIEFTDGLHVIYGHNEAGKSTLHSFIRAMLYGMERGRGRASKTDMWSKYEPWSSSGNYGGVMRISYEDHVYRIERNFAKSAKDVTVTDETAGLAISPDKSWFDKILCGLSETAYTNTISIGQLKSATDGGMVSELKNYIANMNTTGNMALNITKAEAYLKDQRKSYASQIVPEAAKAYTANLAEIKTIEEHISSPEYINHIEALKASQSDASDKLLKTQTQKETLIAKISGDTKTLESNKFSSRESITAFKTKLTEAYSAYKAAAVKAGAKGLRIISIITMALAILLLLLAGYMYLAGPENYVVDYSGLSYNTCFYGVWLACMILFILTMILAHVSRSKIKKYRNCESSLSDLLASQLGDGSISEDAVHAAGARLDGFMKMHDELDSLKKELTTVTSDIDSLSAKQQEYTEDIAKQQRSQWELEKELEHLGNLKDECEALKKVIAENDRLQFEIDAIDLARETMTNLSTTIRDSFGLYLNKEASILIKGITGGIYDSMSIDEDLNIYMNTAEKLVPIDQVSSGTMDQIYLALRLATAKLMQGDGETLPLIFDDSFVNYDEDRLRTALQWLSSNYAGQIIIFTCHKREAQLLSSQFIPYKLIEL